MIMLRACSLLGSGNSVWGYGGWTWWTLHAPRPNRRRCQVMIFKQGMPLPEDPFAEAAFRLTGCLWLMMRGLP